MKEDIEDEIDELNLPDDTGTSFHDDAGPGEKDDEEDEEGDEDEDEDEDDEDDEEEEEESEHKEGEGKSSGGLMGLGKSLLNKASAFADTAKEKLEHAKEKVTEAVEEGLHKGEAAASGLIDKAHEKLKHVGGHHDEPGHEQEKPDETHKG